MHLSAVLYLVGVDDTRLNSPCSHVHHNVLYSVLYGSSSISSRAGLNTFGNEVKPVSASSGETQSKLCFVLGGPVVI